MQYISLHSRIDIFHKNYYFFAESNSVKRLDLDSFEIVTVYQHDKKIFLHKDFQGEFIISDAKSILIFPDTKPLILTQNKFIVISFNETYIVLKTITSENEIELLVSSRKDNSNWKVKTLHHLCRLHDKYLISWATYSTSIMECRNVSDGKMIWSTNINENDVQEDIIQVEIIEDKIAVLSNLTVIILNLNTGTVLERFTFSDNKRSVSDFGVHHNKLYLITSDNSINEISLNTLASVKSPIANCSTYHWFRKPFIFEGYLYSIDNHNKQIMKINMQTMDLNSICSLKDSHLISSASYFYIYNNTMFVHDLSDKLYKINPEADFELVTK